MAITAVIDVALNSASRPVSARALASRNGLPPRHLEPVLQALVHHGILRGVRGPRGGYELGRSQEDITAIDILRAAGTAEDGLVAPAQAPCLIADVVVRALAKAERAFASTLGTIRLDELVACAQKGVTAARAQPG